MPGSTYTFYNPNPDIPLAGDWDSDGDDTPAMLRVAAGSQVAHNRQYGRPSLALSGREYVPIWAGGGGQVEKPRTD